MTAGSVIVAAILHRPVRLPVHIPVKSPFSRRSVLPIPVRDAYVPSLCRLRPSFACSSFASSFLLIQSLIWPLSACVIYLSRRSSLSIRSLLVSLPRCCSFIVSLIVLLMSLLVPSH